MNVYLRYDAVAAAQTLQKFVREFQPKTKLIISNLKNIHERLVSDGQRGEATFWNNKFVSMGVITAEDIKKFSLPPLSIFQKLRKSSLDAGTPGSDFASLVAFKGSSDLKSSNLLKALTLTEGGRAGKGKVSVQFSKKLIFSAEH